MLSDEEYFKRKATIVQYDRKIMRAEIPKPITASISNEALYQEAREKVGDISFIEITKQYPDLFEIHDKKELICDLSMAAVIGFLSFVISEMFVGAPGENKPWAELSDKSAEKQLIKYAEKKAKKVGGIPQYAGKDKLHSSIQFLEKRYPVPYDQAYSKGTNYAVSGMITGNHHFYSASHSPGIGGCFHAIKDQIFDTSTFYQPGGGDKIIICGTGNGIELLAGKTLVGKIIAGFGNWYGHNLSDICGYSKVIGRGSGLPIPMMQYMSRFSGKVNMSDFSKLLCNAYEEGYDYRFGKALAAPVIINDTLTRIVWAVKRYAKTGKKELPICFPDGKHEHYDLSNMLLMSNATFVACDTSHAALKSHGDPITFLCNCNMKAWFNFAIALSRDFLLTTKRAHHVKQTNQNFLLETQSLYESMKW